MNSEISIVEKLKHQFIQEVKSLKLGKPTMVGQAYTLRYIPAREDLNGIEVFRNPKHLQRVAVEECPARYILVIDSRKDARVASAGSILATRLMKRGVAGLITDGGFRYSAEIAALDMPSYHKKPTAPTNLTINQAIAINDPIGCEDVAVFPGDYLVGDVDGIMVIPQHIAEEVANECIRMTLNEEFVMEKVQAGQTIIGLYPRTDQKFETEFEAWKKNR